MTVLHPFEATLPSSRPATAASLHGLGTALPRLACPQQEMARRLAELWQLRGAGLELWRRIIGGSRIEQRFGVAEPEEIVDRSTAERMKLFALHAPALAEQAARRALVSSGFDAAAVTDLIIVTCTGFGAPGLDVDLTIRLGLDPTVRRSQIGFMGCFGAISGFRAAVGACCADPSAVALVVCVELCSLHMRREADPANQVASALFGDGAAAAVVGGAHCIAGMRDSARQSSAPPMPAIQLDLGASLLLPEGRDAMSWTITDAGFAMTLDRRVPEALGANIAGAARAANATPHTRYAIHPGGAGVLEAIEGGLDDGGSVGARGLEHAWSTLRDIGNVSSATVLFVLQRLLAAETHDEMHVLLMAFGPGLTIDAIGGTRTGHGAVVPRAPSDGVRA